MSKKVGYGNPLLNRICLKHWIGGGLFNGEWKYANFSKKNPTPGTERTLEQTLEKIRIHDNFLKNVKQEFVS